MKRTILKMVGIVSKKGGDSNRNASRDRLQSWIRSMECIISGISPPKPSLSGLFLHQNLAYFCTSIIKMNQWSASEQLGAL